jgi:dipeptidase E
MSSGTIVPCPTFRKPYKLNNTTPTRTNKLKGFFAGSGSDSMSNPYMARSVVDLTERSPRDVSLLYIGTASYDIPKFRKNQTNAFIDLGCDVTSLDVANQRPDQDEMEEAVDNADIILVSGGNTLYALDRWRYLGLDEMLRTAAERGTVMAGGSAGAICWFDSGHSDSADPETYRLYKLDKFKAGEPKTTSGKSNNSPFAYYSGNAQDGDTKDWDYIKVKGLGILPGMVCPHYDRIQSNGTPRMQDFDKMLEEFGRYELGIGIDHNAALEVNGDDFRVVSIPGEAGSVPVSDDEEEDGFNCVPGVWLKYVDETGNVQKQVCPRSGSLSDLLQEVNDPDKHFLVDERVDLCRKQNPLLRD